MAENIDGIEVKHVYTERRNAANYYKWGDGASRSTDGYFVSMVPNTDKIQICQGSDILGVLVNDAGFIGGQDFIVPRDKTYGLVATSGLVRVRYQLGVCVGDHVVSNEYGYAKKSDANYGYKVLSLIQDDVTREKYALISLDIAGDEIGLLGDQVSELGTKMDAAEVNILSALNTAQDAYNIAAEAEKCSADASGVVDGLLSSVGQLSSDVATAILQTSNSLVLSEQAKALAQGAITSAEAMRLEAIERAKDAIVANTELRDEFSGQVAELGAKFDAKAAEIQRVKDDMEKSSQQWKSDLDEIGNDFHALAEQMDPIVSFEQDGNIGAAGLVSQAKDNSVKIGEIATWKNGTGEGSLAGFVSTAMEDNAHIHALAEHTYTDKDGKTHKSVAALAAQAEDNAAEIKAIVNIDGDIAGLQARVEENSAAVTTLASHTVGDYITITVWDDSVEDKNKIYYKPETEDEKAKYCYYLEDELIDEEEFGKTNANSEKVYYVEIIDTYWYYDKTDPENLQWKSTDKSYEAGLKGSLAGIQQIADDTKASLDMVTSLSGDFRDSLSGFVATTTEQNAEIQALAQYGGTDPDTGEEYHGAVGIMGEVDKNRASIEAIASQEFTKPDGTKVSGLAGLQAQVDDTNSEVALVANRVNAKYIVIPLDVGEDKRNQDTVYATYNATDNITTYYYYNATEWKSNSNWPPTNHASVIKKDTVYYIAARPNLRYAYWNGTTWSFVSTASAAGIPEVTAGIQAVADDHSSTINSLTSWQGETNSAMAVIEQKADENGAYIQSTVTNMDKYAVGPHSQAYGFTLEQAIQVLEKGMKYVPTEDQTEEEYLYTTEAVTLESWNEAAADVSKVYKVPQGDSFVYYYCSGCERQSETDPYECVWEQTTDIPTYKRTFNRDYLYQWGQLHGIGPYRWITIDKNYNPLEETNMSYPAVAFTTSEPSISGTVGYWYTNGLGVTGGYEPYTLYKWDTYNTVDDDGKAVTKGRWTPVATLAGNAQSRAVSQIRQDANRIELSVTDAAGNAAISKQWIDANSANIQDVVTWHGTNGDSIVTFMSEASDNFASASQIAKVVDENGNVNAASIVAAVTEDSSAISLLADNIDLTGRVTFQSFDAETKKKIEADSIDVQIWSDRGNIFKSNKLSATLSCHVFSAGIEITGTLPNSAFTWHKFDHDGNEVTNWMPKSGVNVKELQITSADVFNRAMFTCEVNIEY